MLTVVNYLWFLVIIALVFSTIYGIVREITNEKNS